jgi:biotin carboxyl carrier protein
VEYRYQVGDETKSVQVERDGEHYVVTVGDQPYRVAVQRSMPETLSFTIDGQHYRAAIAADGPRRYVAFDAKVFAFTKAEATEQRKAKTTEAGNLTATMPGQVVKVLVSEGDSVKRGQPLIIVEAMKMEMRVAAPADGQVVKLLVSTGQIVERGQRLLELSLGG